jgi:hypothetical protein
MKEMIETSQSTMNSLSGIINTQSAVLKRTYSTVQMLLRNVTECDVPSKSTGKMISQTW